MFLIYVYRYLFDFNKIILKIVWNILGCFFLIKCCFFLNFNCFNVCYVIESMYLIKEYFYFLEGNEKEELCILGLVMILGYYIVSIFIDKL